MIWVCQSIYFVYFILVNNYTCRNGYYCSSFYGNSISGSNDSIAMECSSDVNCSAFRYSPKNGFGFKCKDSNPTSYVESYGYEKNDWTLCKFDSGKNMIIFELIFNNDTYYRV